MKMPSSAVTTQGDLDVPNQAGMTGHETREGVRITFHGRIGVMALNALIAEATELRDNLKEAL